MYDIETKTIYTSHVFIFHENIFLFHNALATHDQEPVLPNLLQDYFDFNYPPLPTHDHQLLPDTNTNDPLTEQVEIPILDTNSNTQFEPIVESQSQCDCLL